jgi:hypothetical protein
VDRTGTDIDSIAFGAPILVERGSVSAPGMSFLLDSNTGFYQGSDNANAIGLTAGGFNIMNWTTTYIQSLQNIWCKEGVISDGQVADVGQVGPFSFIDVSAGVARHGAYNYDAGPAAWSPLELAGSTIEINSLQGAQDIRFQFNSADVMTIDNANVDILSGLDLRIRDAGTAVFFDGTDTKSATFGHNATDFTTDFAGGTTLWEIQSSADMTIVLGTITVDMHLQLLGTSQLLVPASTVGFAPINIAESSDTK